MIISAEQRKQWKEEAECYVQFYLTDHLAASLSERIIHLLNSLEATERERDALVRAIGLHLPCPTCIDPIFETCVKRDDSTHKECFETILAWAREEVGKRRKETGFA